MSAMPERFDRWIPDAEDISQEDLDHEIAKLLSGESMTPEEYLSECLWHEDKQKIAHRNLRYAKLQLAISNAFYDPTPANKEAVGECVLQCTRAVLEDEARRVIEEDK